NGSYMALAAGDIGVQGPLFLNNLRNKPLFIVNGGMDRIYPSGLVDPFIQRLLGHVEVAYRPQAGAAHDTSWWPQIRSEFEAFVRDHPRDPVPDTLSWETTDVVSHNRAHWLIIDRLGALPDESHLQDMNEYVGGPVLDFGLRANGTRVV